MNLSLKGRLWNINAALCVYIKFLQYMAEVKEKAAAVLSRQLQFGSLSAFP